MLNYTNQNDYDKGVKVVLVLKRRIINEMMTTYLPTVLILIIVYSTNFFKHFFFEAVVTVNLTALLVLTTLFISVSGSLPPTAYVKLVDVWLIFAQSIPFFEVLLHTFIDNMRTEDSESREINHHGVKITVNSKDEEKKIETDNMNNNAPRLNRKIFVREIVNSENLTNRNEEILVKARQLFYKNAISREVWVNVGEITAILIIPIFIIVFSIIYWWYGLSHYLSNEFSLS
ncbi:glutamate-gated chloride channel alpha [Eurytemora carolleeae]|uniref:glutamate-gated chloride channel alpha n=1 Tax=Eurytemora carolleeae TaxID=1294199 RepID=UPI000C776B9D|nr:glutamate-gated chloride channel alpha [Eurytemora carolleeae]|eukprot:XP_023332214.1 glutamate-gated chloride channel alpha-like [Eurytemora affinis]